MRSSALSIRVFGYYFILFGLSLAVIPNVMLPLFGFETTTEAWIRIFGVVVVAIGYYYLATAKHNVRAFFEATVLGRIWTFCALIVLVLCGLAKPMVVAVAGFEMIGALWTWFALRAEKKQS